MLFQHLKPLNQSSTTEVQSFEHIIPCKKRSFFGGSGAYRCFLKLTCLQGLTYNLIEKIQKGVFI